MNEYCIVCGAKASGWVDGFELCREHYEATGVIRRRFTVNRDALQRMARRQEFSLYFPEVVNEYEKSIRRNTVPQGSVDIARAAARAGFTAKEIEEEREKMRADRSIKNPTDLIPTTHCQGCGRHVENHEIDQAAEYTDEQCDACIFCTRDPEQRYAYRRGFNDGIDKLTESIAEMVRGSGLRKKP